MTSNERFCIERIHELENVIRVLMRAIRNCDDLDQMALAHMRGFDALNGDIDVREEPVR